VPWKWALPLKWVPQVPRIWEREIAEPTEGTVHMSEDSGDRWTRIADEVGCLTKGNHAAALRGEIRPRAAAAAAH
jgi:hypothetical protein